MRALDALCADCSRLNGQPVTAAEARAHLPFVTDEVIVRRISRAARRYRLGDDASPGTGADERPRRYHLLQGEIDALPDGYEYETNVYVAPAPDGDQCRARRSALRGRVRATAEPMA